MLSRKHTSLTVLTVAIICTVVGCFIGALKAASSRPQP